MPTFSRRNREKMIVTKTSGLARVRVAIGASDLPIVKTLHRLRHNAIRSGISQQPSNIANNEMLYANSKPLILERRKREPATLWPRRTFKNLSDSQQTIRNFATASFHSRLTLGPASETPLLNSFSSTRFIFGLMYGYFSPGFEF